MDKSILSDMISQGFSTREISTRMNCGQTNVMYWIRKHNLNIITKVKSEKTCPKCKQILDLSFFYQRRGKIGGSVYCKGCTNSQAMERQKKLKIQCVEYKGGCCQVCNYSKSLSALEFHHLNPSEKEFSLSSKKSFSFNELIKKELDKCILLCANCHREQHD
jgi:hypothetical protein